MSKKAHKSLIKLGFRLERSVWRKNIICHDYAPLEEIGPMMWHPLKSGMTL